MSLQNLAVINNTLQKSEQWLKECQAALGIDNEQEAWSALRAVLQTLRDRLTVDEAADLSAQLPLLLRGLYYEGWKPSAAPQKIRKREEFLERVGERLGRPMETDIESVVRAVFSTMQKHVTEGEVEDVRQMMPEELRELWPAA